jgi:RNA polymerase sigma-70 factor (ECF subfamily)
MTVELEEQLTHQTPLAELVEAARQGDREAFGLLVARYERIVYATVYRRLGDHAEADELCQEVFIQALRKLDQLHEPRCFGGWLRSIADRMAINRAVRRRPVPASDPGMFETACAEQETPLAAILRRERRDQVRAGLRRLRALDRETLVAFYFDGSSLVEMSEKFASPVGTIKRRLHVARRRLAKELQTLATV